LLLITSLILLTAKQESTTTIAECITVEVVKLVLFRLQQITTLSAKAAEGVRSE